IATFADKSPQFAAILFFTRVAEPRLPVVDKPLATRIAVEKVCNKCHRYTPLFFNLYGDSVVVPPITHIEQTISTFARSPGKEDCKATFDRVVHAREDIG